MANKGRDLSYQQLFKIAWHTETDYEEKEPSRHHESSGKTHSTTSKPRKDFGGKPMVRKVQVTPTEPSESSQESSDNQGPPEEEVPEDELYEAWVLKAGLLLNANMVTA